MIRPTALGLVVLAGACATTAAPRGPSLVFESESFDNPCLRDAITETSACWVVTGLRDNREIAARADAWCSEMGFDNNNGFDWRRYRTASGESGAYLAEITCVRVVRD